MIFKSLVDSRHQSSSWGFESQEEPEEVASGLCNIYSISDTKTPEKVVDDFDPTEDGKASEEAHCASD